MPINHMVSAINSLTQRVLSRWVCFPFLLLALLALMLPAPAQNVRNTAEVAIMANLTDSSPLDTVTICMKGSQDKDLLIRLANALGAKYNTAPTFFRFETGEPPFSEGELGLTFDMPVLSNGRQTLPIAGFLETFAPYSARLRIVYIINGPFTNIGSQQIDNPDFALKVTANATPTANLSTPLAIYDVDAIIKNPALGSVSYADNPAGNGTTKRRGMLPIFILFALAVIIGVSGGIIITMLLKQSKAHETAPRAGTPNGGQHERKRDDD